MAGVRSPSPDRGLKRRQRARQAALGRPRKSPFGGVCAEGHQHGHRAHYAIFTEVASVSIHKYKRFIYTQTRSPVTNKRFTGQLTHPGGHRGFHCTTQLERVPVRCSL